jgi:hypothetical protein
MVERIVKIKRGPFAGKDLVFENEGITETIICPKCGWRAWQTFYINEYTVKDIYRSCDICGNKNLVFAERKLDG